jgi:hypothetical protein
MPLLILVLAAAACWAFAVQQVPPPAEWHTSLSNAAECDRACSSKAKNLYGTSQGQGSVLPARGPKDRITALNLAETIFDREGVMGSSLQAAANLMGPPVLPVTGMDTVSDSIQLTLEKQHDAHEESTPREALEEAGALMRKKEFQKLASAVAEQSVVASQPKPPKLSPLDDMLPSRVWTPVFEGCSSKFTEAKCNYYKPNPRLFITNLNELMSARSLLQGREQLIEPLTLRQTHAQFMTMGWRSKKDPYSRASMTNNVAYPVCKAMAESSPEYVVF